VAKDGIEVEPGSEHSVFVSYSHRDEPWKDRLLVHLEAVAHAGQATVWDDRQIGGGDQWYTEIRAAMERASVAVCLITPDFLRSEFCTQEEIPHLLELRQSRGLRLVPVLVHPCAWERVIWLSSLQLLPRDGKSVSADFRDREDEALAAVVAEIEKAIQDPTYRPAPPVARWPALADDLVEITRLPMTGYELFGRQGELAQLDLAWDNYETNVLTFVGWGGVGKSTLVRKWLERLAGDSYRGARRVFGWSFHSQGSRERVTSADEFVDEALRWFGDPDPLVGSPWDKGERLAELVQREQTLLVLDGLEPLQSGSELEAGRIKDPALGTLLEELAQENRGLCVVTTRERIAELEEWPAAAPQISLERLTPRAGAALLRVRGVRGRDDELEQISREFGYDALALSMVASYLLELRGDPVEVAAAIPDDEGSPGEGRHARRLLLAFEQYFGEGPELELLRLLGLFDRPATGPEMGALRAEPRIPDLTAHLSALSDIEWLRLLGRLRDLALLAPENRFDPDAVDAHPVLREHFAEQLSTRFPDASYEGHGRLYEHLRDASEEFPDTVERMLPLYAAVGHAFSAGRYEEALDDVYWPRIQRQKEDFSITRLGAQGLTLAMLADLFLERWTRLPLFLAANRRRSAAILSAAAGCLRNLGRLSEAAEATSATLALDVEQAMRSMSPVDLLNAGIDANSLSELRLLTGPLSLARVHVDEALNYVSETRERFWWIVTMTTLGELLHKVGDLEKAQECFVYAEGIEAELHAEGMRFLPILYARQGFRYCSFLLACGRYDEVLERASQAIEVSDNWPIDIALDHLSLGLAHLHRGELVQADEHLGEAVDGTRAVQDYEWVCTSLLARSGLHWSEGRLEQAASDLDRAMRLSKRAGLRLLELDCHIAEAQVLDAQGETERARQSASAARDLLDVTEYHLRDADLERVEATVSGSS
jgi:tetratricopeptide (TPR) repeat protein